MNIEALMAIHPLTIRALSDDKMDLRFAWPRELHHDGREALRKRLKAANDRYWGALDDRGSTARRYRNTFARFGPLKSLEDDTLVNPAVAVVGPRSLKDTLDYLLAPIERKVGHPVDVIWVDD